MNVFSQCHIYFSATSGHLICTQVLLKLSTGKKVWVSRKFDWNVGKMMKLFITGATTVGAIKVEK